MQGERGARKLRVLEERVTLSWVKKGMRAQRK